MIYMSHQSTQFIISYRGTRSLGSNWVFNYDVEDGRNEMLNMETVLVAIKNIGKKMDTSLQSTDSHHKAEVLIKLRPWL
jgi:hypothetical protein